jgi:hypothetical protein
MSEVVNALAPVALALEQTKTAWCLGGSVASSIYGQPRSTMDVDVIADLQMADVPEFIRLLNNKYYVSEPMILDAIRRKSCFNLIYLATSYKVDVFVLKEREFDQTSMKRIRRDQIGEPDSELDVWVASAEDVILNKLEWYEKGDRTSERQLSDVNAILRGQKQLDIDYLRHWAGVLQVAELLSECLSESGY